MGTDGSSDSPNIGQIEVVSKRVSSAPVEECLSGSLGFKASVISSIGIGRIMINEMNLDSVKEIEELS